MADVYRVYDHLKTLNLMWRVAWTTSDEECLFVLFQQIIIRKRQYRGEVLRPIEQMALQPVEASRVMLIENIGIIKEAAGTTACS